MALIACQLPATNPAVAKNAAPAEAAVSAAAPTPASVAVSSAAAAAQIASGAVHYAEQCAVCHGEQLEGSDRSPPVKGRPFLAKWANKPARALYSRIISTMPQSNPGSLEPHAALDITVFILSSNGQAIPDAGYAAPEELNGKPIQPAG